MRYFPLDKERFEHQFGVRAIPAGEGIVEATELYHAELQQARDLLDSDRDYYFQSLPESGLAQREAFDLIVENAPFLSPEWNALTGEAFHSEVTDPLLEIGRQVQEDLTIMSGDAERGYPLIAGKVCFPSGWCVGEKLGLSSLEIHAPVPEFAEKLHRPMDRLMQALKVGRPVWRMNWGVRPSDRLDQSPRQIDFLAEQREGITETNAGQRCFFRVERQTLARLPETRCILFAIHTHQSRVADLSFFQQRRLLSVMQSCPELTLRYKGLLPIRDSLEKYLSRLV